METKYHKEIHKINTGDIQGKYRGTVISGTIFVAYKNSAIPYCQREEARRREGRKEEMRRREGRGEEKNYLPYL